MILSAHKIKQYVEQFNADDDELYVQRIANAEAAAFLSGNIPLFECPDEGFAQCYYFRWWTYRKHIKETEDGYVITEFLPSVGWASIPNAISATARMVKPFPGSMRTSTPIPANTWDWFCLHNVNYHGRILTILWDKTGRKYGKGKGLQVFADDKGIGATATLQRLEGKL